MSEPLTSECIFAEPAGRRLDEWIARYVFRRTLHHDVRDAEPCDPNDASWYCARCHKALFPGDSLANFKLTPCLGDVSRYSTNIAAAWRIVEWLQERKGYFQLSADIKVHRWYCAWVSGKATAFVTGDTPMIAICRVALLTLANEAEQ